MTGPWLALAVMASQVLAAPEKAGSSLKIAEVGGERLESEASFGDDIPGTPRYVPDRACRIVTARVREALVRRVLRRIGRLPSEEEISQSLQHHLPAPEEFEKQFGSLNREQNDLEDALLQSEVNPTRDNDIWQALAAKYMSYEKWVEYRTRLRGRHPSAMRLPLKVSRAELLEAARGLRALVVEEVFQLWLQTEWVRANPEEEPSTSTAGSLSGPGVSSSWTESLQLRFWHTELDRTPVIIAPEWKCSKIEPADVIAPKAQWPDISK